MAAIYAASQSTLSTGLNSVATSWTLDIQERLSKKEMSFALQTKIAQYVSLGVGIVAILVSMVLANGEIKSAYEWFNGFMGLVLGVAGRYICPGYIHKGGQCKGRIRGILCGSGYHGSASSTWLLRAPVSIWSYSIISIAISLVVGIPVSMITRKMDGDTSKPVKDATIYHN